MSSWIFMSFLFFSRCCYCQKAIQTNKQKFYSNFLKIPEPNKRKWMTPLAIGVCTELLMTKFYKIDKHSMIWRKEQLKQTTNGCNVYKAPSIVVNFQYLLNFCWSIGLCVAWMAPTSKSSAAQKCGRSSNCWTIFWIKILALEAQTKNRNQIECDHLTLSRWVLKSLSVFSLRDH